MTALILTPIVTLIVAYHYENKIRAIRNDLDNVTAAYRHNL